MTLASAYLEEKSVSDIWDIVQSKLRKEYGEATYKSWLSKLEVSSANNGQLILLAPTKFMREWILTHYKDVIKKLWQEHDPSVIKVDILIKTQKTFQNKEETIHPQVVSNSNHNFAEYLFL